MKPAVVLLGALVVVLGLAGFGVFELLELRAATAPPTPEAFVQATWTVYRYAPGHQQHVGQLSLDCTACHTTAKDGELGRPGPTPCLSCHEAQAGIRHALVAINEDGERVPDGPEERRVTDCMRCHSFGPESDVKADDCLRCHSRARGDAPAVTFHAEEACTKCHEVHENRVEPMACTTCHPTALAHEDTDAGIADQCLDCHKAHGSSELALDRCADCHGPRGVKPVPASATAGQHECIGCHKPHTFDKAHAGECRTCHESQHVLAGAGHSECTACHAPHDVRGSVEKNVCTSCHADIALAHGQGPEAGGSCTGCHDPHPARGGRSKPTCESCHADIGAQGKHAHKNDMACTQCHEPHRFVAGEEMRSTCVGCHSKQLGLIAQNPGHTSCSSCHADLPHGNELAPKACGSCHGEQARVVSAGHSTCTSCHEPHTGDQLGKSCTSCHAEQAGALLHPAKALSCTSCHDQHAGTPAPDVADCSACHKKSDLPGLHEVAQHNQRCTSCHAAHGASKPGDRAACLSCHTAQADHQPEATRCNGCHTFTTGARRRP